MSQELFDLDGLHTLVVRADSGWRIVSVDDRPLQLRISWIRSYKNDKKDLFEFRCHFSRSHFGPSFEVL
jgi:hypothetical protein